MAQQVQYLLQNGIYVIHTDVSVPLSTIKQQMHRCKTSMHNKHRKKNVGISWESFTHYYVADEFSNA